jgi:hypothetical protein
VGSCDAVPLEPLLFDVPSGYSNAYWLFCIVYLTRGITQSRRCGLTPLSGSGPSLFEACTSLLWFLWFSFSCMLRAAIFKPRTPWGEMFAVSQHCSVVLPIRIVLLGLPVPGRCPIQMKAHHLEAPVSAARCGGRWGLRILKFACMRHVPGPPEGSRKPDSSRKSY